MYYQCLLHEEYSNSTFTCFFKYSEAPFQFKHHDKIFTLKKVYPSAVQEVPIGELLFKRNNFYRMDSEKKPQKIYWNQLLKQMA